MANLEIVHYIKERYMKGVSPDAVRQALKTAGWKDVDIEAAMREVPPPAGVATSSVGSNDLAEIKAALMQLNNRLAKLEGTNPQDVAPVFNPKQTFPKREPLPVSGVTTFHDGAVFPDVVSEGPRDSVESKITGKWFAGIGVIALLFGIGFFLKYAFDNNLIGVTGRVVMGIVAGVCLLVLGDFLSRKEKYRQYSFFVSGGGLAILYLSIYGAFAFYHLIDQVPAFIFMLFITAAGAVLAVKSDGVDLAGISLLGGFLTPFLVTTGTDNEVALFTYVLILNLSFLGISYFKKWPRIYLLNFIGTYGTLYLWYLSYYTAAKLGVTLFFLTDFLLIFLIAPFLVSIVHKQKSSELDVVVSGLNAAAYFMTAYTLLKPDYEPMLGFFFVAWAAVYLAVAYVLSTMNEEDTYAVYALAGVGLVLVTVAVPIQLHTIWITIAWAVEGFILTWTGFSLGSPSLRKFADGILILAIVRVIFLDSTTVGPLETFLPLFNERFLTFFVVVASLFASAYLYVVNKETLPEDEQSMAATMGVAANLLLVGILSSELSRYFDRQVSLLSSSAVSAADVYPPSDSYGQVSTLRNVQNLSLSILWGVYAGMLTLVGILKHSRASRILAIVGFGIVILKVFLYDASQLSDLYRIISFITLGVILLVISFLFYRYKDKVKEFLLT